MRTGFTQRQSFIFGAVSPIPHLPLFASGRFAKGHSLVASGCNFLNSCSRDDGVNPLRVLVFVVAEYQRIEVPARWRVPADDEFLATVDSHLPPGARPLARLIAAVTAFRDQPFQPC